MMRSFTVQKFGKKAAKEERHRFNDILCGNTHACCVKTFRSALHWAGVMGTKDDLWTVYSFKLAECPEQEVQWVLL